MERLRFALFASKGWLDGWHLRCLGHLEQVATLSAIVHAANATHARAAQSSSIVKRLPGGRGGGMSTVDFARRLPNMPPFYTAPDELAITAAGLDFVLKLGQGRIPPPIARAAHHGLWYFEHELMEGLPFFREVYEGEDVTYAALAATCGRGATLVEGFFATEKRSYAAHRHRVLTTIAEWPARVCREVQGPGIGVKASAISTGRSATADHSPALLTYCARILRRRVAFAWKRLFCHDQWNIGILRVPVATLLSPGRYRDERIEWFPLPDRAAFLADPFGVVRDGTIQICCEYFRYRGETGEIHCLQYANGGFSRRLERALALPVHGSYPFLIDHGGEIYCVPETSQANEVALFKAVDFPRRWSKIAVLVTKFAGVDPTVFRHGGRWWLTCTERGREADTSLWMWHASDLHGPWTPHVRNPVKIDVRSARPGGRPFVVEGQLYRPAQDCSRRYGWRISLQRVTRLTPSEFEEEPVTVLAPSPDSPFPMGRHTLTPIDDIVLIDGHRTVFVWAAWRSFVRIWAGDLVRSFTRSCRDLRR
jgi:hypothetical protein